MGTPYAVSSDLVSAYPAKSLAIAQYIDGYKLDTGPVQNAQTGTSYSFAITDTTKTVTANNAAASAYTVPPQSSVVWEAYTVLRILNLGAGVVTLTAGAGVTLTGTVTVAQYASATLTRTGSNAWTISGNASASGMDLITPTGVANATLSGGQITFSAAATVSINGCFTSTFDSYDLVYYSNSATDQEIRFRMRLSGTDNSASSYDYQTTIGAATSLSTARLTAQTTGFITRNLGSGTGATMRITAPALAANTVSRVYAVTYTGINIYDVSNAHAVATAYDGITLIPSTGTLTGTVRIYGLRNS